MKEEKVIPARPKLKGLFLRIISMILGLTGLITVLGLQIMMSEVGGRFVYYLITVLAVSLVGWSAYLYRHGKRISVLTADELISKDQRAPVVYLRSFEDDKLTSDDTQALMRRQPFTLPASIKSEEESLA